MKNRFEPGDSLTSRDVAAERLAPLIIVPSSPPRLADHSEGCGRAAHHRSKMSARCGNSHGNCAGLCLACRHRARARAVVARGNRIAFENFISRLAAWIRGSAGHQTFDPENAL